LPLLAELVPAPEPLPLAAPEEAAAVSVTRVPPTKGRELPGGTGGTLVSMMSVVSVGREGNEVSALGRSPRLASLAATAAPARSCMSPLLLVRGMVVAVHRGTASTHVVIWVGMMEGPSTVVWVKMTDFERQSIGSFLVGMISGEDLMVFMVDVVDDKLLLLGGGREVEEVELEIEVEAPPLQTAMTTEVTEPSMSVRGEVCTAGISQGRVRCCAGEGASVRLVEALLLLLLLLAGVSKQSTTMTRLEEESPSVTHETVEEASIQGVVACRVMVSRGEMRHSVTGSETTV